MREPLPKPQIGQHTRDSKGGTLINMDLVLLLNHSSVCSWGLSAHPPLPPILHTHKERGEMALYE